MFGCVLSAIQTIAMMKEVEKSLSWAEALCCSKLKAAEMYTLRSIYL